MGRRRNFRMTFPKKSKKAADEVPPGPDLDQEQNPKEDVVVNPARPASADFIPYEHKETTDESDGMKKFIFCGISERPETPNNEPWCIVCGSVLRNWDQKCPDMFQSRMQFDGGQLYFKTLEQAIRHSLSPDDTPTKAICCKCCLQMEETVRLELRLNDIKTELNKSFTKTVQHLMIGTIGKVWKQSHKKSRIRSSELVEDDSSTTESDSDDSPNGKCKIRVSETMSLADQAKSSDESSTPAKIRIMDPASINKSFPSPPPRPEPKQKSPKQDPFPFKMRTEHRKVSVKAMEKILLGTANTPEKKTPQPTDPIQTTSVQPNATEEVRLSSISGNEMDPLSLSNLLSEIKDYDPSKSNAESIEVQPDMSFLNGTVTAGPINTAPRLIFQTPFANIAPKPALPGIQPYFPLATKAKLVKIVQGPLTNSLQNPLPVTAGPAPRILGGNRMRLIITKNGAKMVQTLPRNAVFSNGGKGSPTSSTIDLQNGDSHKQKRKSTHVVRLENSNAATRRTSVGVSLLKTTSDKKQEGPEAVEPPVKVADSHSILKKKPGRPRLHKRPRSQKVDLNSILSSVTASESESPVTDSGRIKRGAFQKASKRLEIIANYHQSQKSFSNPKKWMSKMSKNAESGQSSEEDSVEEVVVKKKLRLMEARVVLTNVMNKSSEEEKDVSMSSRDNSFSKSQESEKAGKSDVESVCNQIEKVILESPKTKKKKGKKIKKVASEETLTSDIFVCDICKLDFVKLDELRNHIEQDHFAPSY
ncbi:uncharacterized protein LOC132200760 [Neocloeon triangulifer]|uniref:uncharacterized protein LOC132200760 n=1 Tax=Neocloeon triangulifer TaxID=2078957 RepID=UPI00286F7052|nr:uncharacterized protein LOC132200760 [Neocloeon triangulifer]